MSRQIKLIFSQRAHAALGFDDADVTSFEQRVSIVPALKGERGNDGRDGRDGTPGSEGKSAYQIAVDAGFIGTEQEWLETLKSAVVPTSIGSLAFLCYNIYCDPSFWPEGYVALSQDWSTPTRVLAIEYPQLEPYFQKETVYQGAGFTYGGLDMVIKVANGAYTVTESSSYGGNVFGRWGAANVFDGQVTSDTLMDAWASGGYAEQWIGVQFDVPKVITSVMYCMLDDSGGASVATLQYYDGTKWVNVGGQHSLDTNPKATNRVDYSQNSISALKWRFHFGYGDTIRMGEIHIGTPEYPLSDSLFYKPGQAIEYYNLGVSYSMGSYYPFVFVGGKNAVPV